MAVASLSKIIAFHIYIVWCMKQPKCWWKLLMLFAVYAVVMFLHMSMLKTIERYQKYSYAASEATVPMNETQYSYLEYLKLKARAEVLQHSQRNLLGEDLGPLSARELGQLENQLVMSLKQVRSTKTQEMLDQLCDLKRKEQMLQEANRSLKEKLQETGSKAPLQVSWKIGGGGSNSTCVRQPAHSGGFFQPLQRDPPLQIGYHPMRIDQLYTGATPQNVSGYFLNGWDEH